MFLTNRDTTRNTIEVIAALFSEYLANTSRYSGIEGFFAGTGSARTILQPLITRIVNSLIPRIDSLLQKILSYEVRLRSELMKCLVQLLLLAVEFTESERGSINYDSIGSSLFSHNIQEEFAFKQSSRSSTSPLEKFSLRDFLKQLLTKYLFTDMLNATYEYQVISNTYANIVSILYLTE